MTGKPAGSSTVVIFGAAGDLTRPKATRWSKSANFGEPAEAVGGGGSLSDGGKAPPQSVSAATGLFRITASNRENPRAD